MKKYLNLKSISYGIVVTFIIAMIINICYWQLNNYSGVYVSVEDSGYFVPME